MEILGSARLLVGILSSFLAWTPGEALTVTDYSSAANDRFASGYPTAPMSNSAPEFVGVGLDWRGVGWAASDATKNFVFLGPAHYLVARHYGGAANVRVFPGGELLTRPQAGSDNIGLGVILPDQTLGDLALGTLQTPFPAAVLPRYAVLDLNPGSTENLPSAYKNLSLLLYGRGSNGTSSPRLGLASSNSVSVSGNTHELTTSRTAVQLESGDSGSPAFHPWVNPDGGRELTAVGNHAAVNSTSNFINFLGSHEVMTALATRMSRDGYALRVAGTPTNTWDGNSSTDINDRGAWGLRRNQILPSDKFVTFDAAAAGSERVVTVNTSHDLRGLYFKSTEAANDGFSFGGSAVLKVGRGGITNYDNSRQNFVAPLMLGHSQFWNGGSGGITAGAIDTNGMLLEISGSGTTRITGGISGSGALAVSGGRVELAGGNSYTGNTYVWNGTLALGSPSLGDETNVHLGAGGTLELGFSGGDSIGQFLVNGVLMPPGVYGREGAGSDVIGISSLTGDGLLLVGGAQLSAYSKWAGERGLEAINDGPSLDPDGDGLANLLEFVLGGDPLASSSHVLPQASLEEDYFVFTFTRAKESGMEVALAFNWGTNLTEWPHKVAIGAQSAEADLLHGVVITVTEGALATDPDSIRIALPLSNAVQGKLFGRLTAAFAD